MGQSSIAPCDPGGRAKPRAAPSPAARNPRPALTRLRSAAGKLPTESERGSAHARLARRTPGHGRTPPPSRGRGRGGAGRSRPPRRSARGGCSERRECPAGRGGRRGRAAPVRPRRVPSRPVAFRLVPFPRPASVPRRAQPDPAPREAPLLLRRPRGAAGMGGASLLPPHWAIARGTPRPHSTCTRWSGRGAGRG